MRVVCHTSCRCGRRSALEDAANEDGHDDLHDSDDDLLESSDEDEDEDLIQSPQRMPEPRVVKSAQPKDPSTLGSSTKTSAFDAPSNNPVGSDGAAGGSSGSGSRTRTTGARPSVALQMQDMEGRPSADDGPPMGAENSDDARGHRGSLESTDDSGNTEKSIREYMVSERNVSLPQHCCLFSLHYARPRRRHAE